MKDSTQDTLQFRKRMEDSVLFLILDTSVHSTQMLQNADTRHYHPISQGDWFVLINLQDAYFHISIHLHHHKFLQFRLDNILYQFCSLPFGLSMAPRNLPNVWCRQSYPIHSQYSSRPWVQDEPCQIPSRAFTDRYLYRSVFQLPTIQSLYSSRKNHQAETSNSTILTSSLGISTSSPALSQDHGIHNRCYPTRETQNEVPSIMITIIIQSHYRPSVQTPHSSTRACLSTHLVDISSPLACGQTLLTATTHNIGNHRRQPLGMGSPLLTPQNPWPMDKKREIISTTSNF